MASRRSLLPLLLLLPLLGLAGWFLSRHVRLWQHERAAREALARRDFASAREHSRRSLSLSRDADSLVLAAQLARRDDDLADAQKLLDAAVKSGALPEAIDIEQRLARLQSGDLRGAERFLAVCRESAQDNHVELILEALCVGSLRAMNLHLAHQAISLWLEKRTGDIDHAQGLVWRGEAALRRGEGEAALADFREALRLDPNNEAARRKVAEIASRYEASEALGHVERLLEKAPHDRALRLLLARCHRSLGEAEEARRLLDALLAERGNDPDVLVERGLVELDLARPADAEPWLRKAVELAPQRRDPNAAMARCLRLAGKPDEAVAFEKRLVAIDAEIQRKYDELSRPKGNPK